MACVGHLREVAEASTDNVYSPRNSIGARINESILLYEAAGPYTTGSLFTSRTAMFGQPWARH